MPTRMGSGTTSAVARSSTMLAVWTLLTRVLQQQQPLQQPPPQQQHLQQPPHLVDQQETPQLLLPLARQDIEMKARHWRRSCRVLTMILDSILFLIRHIFFQSSFLKQVSKS